MPVIINKDNRKSYNFDAGLKIRFIVEARNGEVTIDYNIFDWEGLDGYRSEKVDATYGVMVNLSDEEIEKLTLERNASLDANEYYYDTLKGIDEKYLTPNFIKRREEAAEQAKRNRIKDLQDKIASQTEELKSLTV